MATMLTDTAKLAMAFAGKVNTAIEDFEKSDQTGIQAFGASLRKMIAEAKLGKHEWIHFSQVCPHEDNRDGELLIPIEVWKLLLKIIRKGWSYIECDKSLTCGIPTNADGDRWKFKAMRLAQQSDGLLPPYLPERLTAASAAGSHTTAVLRLLHWAGEFNIPCPDDMFASICPNGYMSQSTVLAMQPSFKEPLEKRHGVFPRSARVGPAVPPPYVHAVPIRQRQTHCLLQRISDADFAKCASSCSRAGSHDRCSWCLGEDREGVRARARRRVSA
jgi:hypothetical protein